MKSLIAFTAAFLCAAAPAVRAAIYVSGRPVPEMTVFDTIMTDYMTANSIDAGILGIMHEGRVVYQRGFGNMNPGVPLPENATFRIASLSKAITAAAIRMMAADGTFGAQGIDRKAFNLTVSGNNNGGLLNITPWPSLGDNDIAQITIRHLLDHESGFDSPDCVFRDGSRQVATDMSLGRPPTNTERIRWMLGKPLPYTPGVEMHYSNFGYLVLGYIIDQLGGGYLSFLHNRVLTAAGWVPASELFTGKTLESHRTPREPRYINTATGPSVFDYSNPIETLQLPYGGYFDMDALLGAGHLVASVPAMLDFGNRFHIWYPYAGVPVSGPLTNDGHDGGLSGLSSKLEVLPGNTVMFFAFTKDSMVGGVWPQIKSTIQAGTAYTWPATTSDGHWITLPAGNPNTGYGNYDAPWQGFGSSLSKADSGSRLRLKAGTSNWTGRITKRMKLDAPLGTARLGVP